MKNYFCLFWLRERQSLRVNWKTRLNTSRKVVIQYILLTQSVTYYAILSLKNILVWIGEEGYIIFGKLNAFDIFYLFVFRKKTKAQFMIYIFFYWLMIFQEKVNYITYRFTCDWRSLFTEKENLIKKSRNINYKIKCMYKIVIFVNIPKLSYIS